MGWRESLSLVAPNELRARCSALSEVIDPGRYDDPLWIGFHRDLESYATDKHVFRHISGEVVRKGYEWTQCIYGLALLGMLKPEARALGVGAGHEPVIFWLADRIGHVTATDLYGNETWQSSPGAEGTAEVFTAPEQYCARPIAKEKIAFQNADGTKLAFPDDSFDLCWSLSSIEHFGGHEAAARAMREMARVTRPGGIVCVATEVLLKGDKDHPEFFTRRQFLKHVLRASGDLAVVGRMDWRNPPQEYLDDPIILWDGIDRKRRHVVMQDSEYQWTSAIAFLRKGDATAPAWLDLARAILPAGTRPAPPRHAYALSNFRKHNGAVADLVGSTLRVAIPDQPWAYGVEFPLLLDDAERVEVELTARATGNAVRVGLLSADGASFIQEIELRPEPEFSRIKLAASRAAQAMGSLVVRASAHGGGTAELSFVRL